MPVRDLLRPQNPLINDTNNPKTLGGPGDGTISGLLGGGLPEGSTVSIKVGGNQALKPKTTGGATTAGPTATTPPPGGPPTTQGGTALEGDTQPGPCPDGQEFVFGVGCMDVCKVGEIRELLGDRRCVPNPFDLEPWKACEERGGKWTSTDPLLPHIGTCDYDAGKDECWADGGAWDFGRKECNYGTASCARLDLDYDPATGKCVPRGDKEPEPEPPEPEPPDPEPCDPKTEHWNPATKRCEPNVTAPSPPGEDGKVAPPDLKPPEDWGDYFNYLYGGDDEFQTEMRYWNAQKGIIEGAFNEEWLKTEAQLAASGYAYSTESQLVGVYQQKALAQALNMAYETIMYTALDRKLQKQKMAQDFFLGDKSLNIQHMYQQGTLDVAYLRLALDESLGWAQIGALYEQMGITREQLELELFKSITERMVAEAMIDQNWAQIYAVFIKLAIELGMSEEEAREFYNGLMDQYGHETVI